MQEIGREREEDGEEDIKKEEIERARDRIKQLKFSIRPDITVISSPFSFLF